MRSCSFFLLSIGLALLGQPARDVTAQDVTQKIIVQNDTGVNVRDIRVRLSTRTNPRVGQITEKSPFDIAAGGSQKELTVSGDGRQYHWLQVSYRANNRRVEMAAFVVTRHPQDNRDHYLDQAIVRIRTADGSSNQVQIDERPTGTTVQAPADDGAQSGEDDSSDSATETSSIVVFGIHPNFLGDSFTMECNCRALHDRNAACRPNCCLLAKRDDVIRMWIVGRCRELPGRPYIYRVRLRQTADAKADQAADATQGLMFVEDGEEMEVELPIGGGAAAAAPAASATQEFAEGVVSGLDVQHKSLGNSSCTAFITSQAGDEIQVFTADAKLINALAQASGNVVKLGDHRPPVEVTYHRGSGGVLVLDRIRFLDR